MTLLLIRQVNNKFIDSFANDPNYKQAQLSIMVHYYSILCRKYDGDIKNVPCQTIKLETEEFRNRQDALNRFITQLIVKSPGAEAIGLPVIATKYTDWYNANVKPTKQSIIDVQAQFENSRIASSLEHRISGIKFLLGHRMLDSISDQIQSNESYLFEVIPKDNSDIKLDITSDIKSDINSDVNSNINSDINSDVISDYNWSRPSKNTDEFVSNLINNAPKHIQSCDNIVVEDINFNDILAAI